MGMTIDKAIPKIQFVRNALNDDMEIAKAYDLAIDTMRKYQKIEELIEYHLLRVLPKERMSGFQKDILEVIDNGNVD